MVIFPNSNEVLKIARKLENVKHRVFPTVFREYQIQRVFSFWGYETNK